MKRRILIALTILTPVALFIPLKQLAYWRPIQIVKADSSSYGSAFRLEVSPDGKYVAAATEYDIQVFDASLGTRILHREYGGGASDDLSVVAIAFSKSGTELFVATRFSSAIAEGFGAIERLPLDGVKNRAALQKVLNNDNFLDAVDLRSAQDGTHLQFDGRVWNLKSGKLVSQKSFSTAFDSLGMPAFMRDGSLVRYCLNERSFAEADLRSGVVRKITIQNPSSLESINLSRYGSYAFIKLKNGSCIVRDFQTGRKLWTFPASATYQQNVIVNDAESRIAIPVGGEWQIRDLKTGELINSINNKTIAQIGTWSLDGNMIYWQDKDANLWKQHVQ